AVRWRFGGILRIVAAIGNVDEVLAVPCRWWTSRCARSGAGTRSGTRRCTSTQNKKECYTENNTKISADRGHVHSCVLLVTVYDRNDLPIRSDSGGTLCRRPGIVRAYIDLALARA